MGVAVRKSREREQSRVASSNGCNLHSLPGSYLLSECLQHIHHRAERALLEADLRTSATFTLTDISTLALLAKPPLHWDQHIAARFVMIYPACTAGNLKDLHVRLLGVSDYDHWVG